MPVAIRTYERLLEEVSQEPEQIPRKLQGKMLEVEEARQTMKEYLRAEIEVLKKLEAEIK